MASKESQGMGCLATIANVIWFITGGLVTGLAWLLLGVIFCITIIGIPVGKQCFKFMRVSFFPFGKKVNLNFGKHMIANVLWLIFIGWEMFILYLTMMAVNAITIIGIPSAVAAWKVCKLSIGPFGASVN